MESILSALMVSCYQHTPTATTPPGSVSPRDASDDPDVAPDEDLHPTIWDFVEACETTAVADKASAIRSHLEQAVGKVGAAEMLRDAYATSSRDQAGKKQRILSLDGKAIRIKKG